MNNKATVKENVQAPSLDKANIEKSKKANSRNLGVLIKQRFTTLWFHLGRIITFAIFAIIFVVANELSMKWINTDMQPWLSNVFVIVASAVAGILMVILAVIMFRGEAKNNQINLELREGYKPREIYLSRIVEMIFAIGVFMVIAIICNLITIGAKKEMGNVIWYHMYVSSLGWYAIVCIIAAGMTIFFCGFMKSGWCGTLGTLIMLICIVIGSIIPGLAAIGKNSKSGSNDYAGEIMSKKIDNDVLDFAENQLGIGSMEQANGVINAYGEAVKDDIVSQRTGIDWSSYGEMVLGQFPSNQQDPDSNYKYNFTDVNPSEYLVDPNAFGAVAAFGTGLFEDGGKNELPDKLVKFFNDTKKFFSNNNKEFKFNDITNWDILDGKSTNKFVNKNVYDKHTGTSGVEKVELPRTGKTIVDENFQKIMNSISGSNGLAKEYPFLKDLAKTSDANALSLMFNEKGNKYNPDGGSNEYLMSQDNMDPIMLLDQRLKTTDNIDYSQKIYPEFAIGGYIGTDGMTDVQSQIEKFTKVIKMTPAEFLFNRNIMFDIVKAFTDLNQHAYWKTGRTILRSNAIYYAGDNTVVLYVNNAFEFRYGNATYGMSDLQHGTLPKDALEGLAITLGDKTYHAKDMMDLEYVSSHSRGYVRNYGNDKYVSDNYNKITDHDVITFSLKDKPKLDDSNGSYYTKSAVIIGTIKYSTNPKLMISDSINDLSYLYNGTSDASLFATRNKWASVEYSKTIISNIRLDKDKEKDKVSISLWGPCDDSSTMKNLKNIEFKFGTNIVAPEDISWGADKDNAIVTAEFNDELSGKLKISFDNDDAKSSINTNLIDGSFFLPSFPYKESETHKTAMSWIYNPLTQLQAMFNGVNYGDNAMDNLLSSFMKEKYFGVNSLNVRISVSQSKNNPYANAMNVQRSSYVEIVYIYYVFVEALFVFVGFWMYRKSIVS